MVKCTFCDKRNARNATQCENCGAELTPPPRDNGNGSTEDLATDPFEERVIALMAQGNKIAAIKLHREETGDDLKTSKLAVEELAAQGSLIRRYQLGLTAFLVAV